MGIRSAVEEICKKTAAPSLVESLQTRQPTDDRIFSGPKGILIAILLAHYLNPFTICHESFAQSQFQLAIGGATTGDYAYSIIQTADGGYVAAGETHTGNSDMYIVKLSSTGTLQWSKTVGGTQQEIASSIVRAADGGYVVASYGESWGLGAYFTKLDSVGAVEWTRVVGGTMNLNYRPVPMVRTTDGGYAAAGTLPYGPIGYQDMCILKLDADCTPVWCKIFGATLSADYAWCIIQTTDGGYAVAGQTPAFGAGGDDMFVVKFDSTGTLQWSKTVGGTSSDIAYSVIQTTDGGYAVAGRTLSFGEYEMYIVKLTSSGMLQWSKTLCGRAYSIIQTNDGGYAIAGYTGCFGAGIVDMYIVKLDPGGSLQWSRTVGGTGFDIGYSIIQTTDGGYAVAGYTQSFGAGGDMFIVKLDANGNTCGNSTSPSDSVGTGGTMGSPSPTVTVVSPSITTPSPTIGSLNSITTICIIGIQPISNEIPSRFGLSQNYPNPFNGMTNVKFQIPKSGNIRLVIYDVLGSNVETLVNQELKPGVYQVEWDGTNYASGVYYYQLSIINPSADGLSIEYQETNRMVLIR